MTRSNLVDVDVVLKHETANAYLIETENEQGWVPKSQVEMSPDMKVCTMPDWLAQEKGFV